MMQEKSIESMKCWQENCFFSIRSADDNLKGKARWSAEITSGMKFIRALLPF